MVTALAILLAWQVVERNTIFDDALISFRYARNLATGDGLVWNRGEAPVEGYTNFLLVAALAPAISVGLAPLWTTRVWSLVAALALALLIGREAARLGASRLSSLLAAAAFLLMSRTAELATVGLETVIFTALFFATFSQGRRLLAELEPRRALACSLLGFLAFLTRPEALMLVGLLGVGLYSRVRQRRQGAAASLLALVVGFGVPLLLYLGWKLAYFGSIVPNAAFVKATSSGWLSERGLASVTEFFRHHRLLVLLAALSPLAMHSAHAARAGDRVGRRIAATCIALWGLFYLRIDTLMDVHGRFLYPVTPLVFFLALPAIVPILERLLDWSAGHRTRAVAAFGILLLLVPLQPLASARTLAEAALGVDRFAARSAAIAKDELAVARALAGYTEIRDVTIAWGNAGVIPWITDAKFLDMVGLNDSFLARNRSLPALVDYFFSRRADLVILPTDGNGDWFGGHSYLGSQLPEWDHDPRWDGYRFIGTLRTARGRDHHYYLRTDSAHARALERLLQADVLGRFADAPPPPLGSDLSNLAAGRFEP